mmetsp:Transcript_27853/g.47345  ORF Transcript_27853/g.47345 Transcript_27853/m.47345 type:complete len:97 (-) Transcript_27853:22-312(-)
MKQFICLVCKDIAWYAILIINWSSHSKQMILGRVAQIAKSNALFRLGQITPRAAHYEAMLQDSIPKFRRIMKMNLDPSLSCSCEARMDSRAVLKNS